MVTQLVYTAVLGVVACERIAEMWLSRRNAKWSFAQGGREYGQGHFPFMVVLHTGFLLGCVAEVWFCHRTFEPMLGTGMFALALLCQGLRWWVIGTLGHQWNARVIVVPDLPRVTGGPFRHVPHPNYVAVVLEGIALPMIHGAWITALIFTLLNLPLLAVRIRCEERALKELSLTL